MAQGSSELVTEFCRLWASPVPEELAGYFAEDAVYHNIPMESIHGRAAIKEFITRFTTGYDGIDFLVHRQVGDGGLVMNERTDVLRRKDGTEVRLPVVGVFEIADGRIAAWRDYFDLATFTKASG